VRVLGAVLARGARPAGTLAIVTLLLLLTVSIGQGSLGSNVARAQSIDGSFLWAASGSNGVNGVL